MGPTPYPLPAAPPTNRDPAGIVNRSFEGSCMLSAATAVLVMICPLLMESMWGMIDETKRTL